MIASESDIEFTFGEQYGNSAVRAANDGAGGSADFRRDGHLPDGEGCRARGGIAERSAHGGQHRRVEGHPAEGERAGRIGGCGHEAPCGGNSLRRPDAHEHRRGDCGAGGCAGGGGESREREKDTYAAGTKKSICQGK